MSSAIRSGWPCLWWMAGFFRASSLRHSPHVGDFDASINTLLGFLHFFNINLTNSSSLSCNLVCDLFRNSSKTIQPEYRYSWPEGRTKGNFLLVETAIC